MYGLLRIERLRAYIICWIHICWLGCGVGSLCSQLYTDEGRFLAVGALEDGSRVDVANGFSRPMGRIGCWKAQACIFIYDTFSLEPFDGERLTASAMCGKWAESVSVQITKGRCTRRLVRTARGVANGR